MINPYGIYLRISVRVLGVKGESVKAAWLVVQSVPKRRHSICFQNSGGYNNAALDKYQKRNGTL